ncbi:MAG: hypothetical protein ABI563_06355 [Specibacter sp.]
MPTSFLCAGLPAAISDILNEGVATFLRRADRIDLHAVDIQDVEESYARQFTEAGFIFPDGTMAKFAAATLGYPLLVQLIGYFLWREAENGGGTVAPDDVQKAIDMALKRTIRMAVGPAIARASDRDMSYLRAMSVDTGP